MSRIGSVKNYAQISLRFVWVNSSSGSVNTGKGSPLAGARPVDIGSRRVIPDLAGGDPVGFLEGTAEIIRVAETESLGDFLHGIAAGAQRVVSHLQLH